MAERSLTGTTPVLEAGHWRGILFMLLGTALFTFNDALGKWMVASVAVGQLLFIRSATALVVLLPMVHRTGWRQVFVLEQPGRHAVRLALIVAEVACFYLAVRHLPLADVMAVYQATPLIVTVLAKGKSADSFGPIGPWLVTTDEVPDPQNLDMFCDVNGKRFQNGSTKTMVYGVRYLVSYLSQFMSLQPGDIISTGTPPGVGMGQKPPVYLKDGDAVHLGIVGLGEQRQKVRNYRA